MKEDHLQFKSRNVRIVVVAPHGPEKVEAYWKKEGLPYHGIPDPDGQLGKLYGQEWNLIKLGRMPAMFIIGLDPRIVFSHYAKNMADIPSNSDILAVLDGMK